MTEPIRVLPVVASLNAGGMENYIMNLYRMVDKSKVRFDFVVPVSYTQLDVYKRQAAAQHLRCQNTR